MQNRRTTKAQIGGAEAEPANDEQRGGGRDLRKKKVTVVDERESRLAGEVMQDPRTPGQGDEGQSASLGGGTPAGGLLSPTSGVRLEPALSPVTPGTAAAP